MISAIFNFKNIMLSLEQRKSFVYSVGLGIFQKHYVKFRTTIFRRNNRKNSQFQKHYVKFRTYSYN